MCLIAFAYKVSSEYPLILIANRDEFYDRPTQKAHYWCGEGENKILAGKDLKAGGTWMGVGKNGKWAAVTNYRDMESIKVNAPTRGNFVPQFIKSKSSAHQYLLELKKEASKYNGFNLLLGDSSGVFHYSNVSDTITKIQPGVHGVSNALLNTPWPKLNRAKKMLENSIQNNDFSKTTLFSLLNDETKAQENQLPNTGLSKELEKELSSIFIDIDNYGTRCSSLLLIDKNEKIKFVERRYNYSNSAKEEEETFIL